MAPSRRHEVAQSAPAAPYSPFPQLLVLASSLLSSTWAVTRHAKDSTVAFLAPSANTATVFGRPGLTVASRHVGFDATEAPGVAAGRVVARLATGVFGLAAVVASLKRKGIRRPSRVGMSGWGDDVTFHVATVQENVEAAEGLRLITIDAPADVTNAFEKPGQFVQAKPADDAKPAFYAISSPPTQDGPLEFLIKEAESNQWIVGAGRGDALKLSAAMGRGFATGSDGPWGGDVGQVGIFATGSGIAPIRAAIESGALDGKVCRLYLGARTEGSLAYPDRFEAWRKRGVEVIPVLSRAGGGWVGRNGYVQQAFKEDEERGEGFVLADKHGALLCGQKEMVAAVRAVYEGLGVSEERTLLNF